MTTIKDVAQRAGVSLSTASIVANGKSKERKISVKTQNKVMDAMRELNYIPSVSAKTLRKGETRAYTVALFWTFDYRSNMMNRLLSGVQKRITETCSNMSVVVHPYKVGDLKREQKCFENGEFHAAIIANANMDDLAFLKECRFQIPIILYNRFLEGYSSVNLDDSEIGTIAAEHLYEKGYRNPQVIHGIQSFPGTTRREEAFISRMKELGVDIEEKEIIQAANSMQGGYECAKRILEQENTDFDSFFCSTDMIVYGMIRAFYDNDIDIRKYGMLAIGNTDPQMGKYSIPSISVINVPIEKMGSQCGQFLIDQMFSPQKSTETRIFKPELVVRDSTMNRYHL